MVTLNSNLIQSNQHLMSNRHINHSKTTQTELNDSEIDKQEAVLPDQLEQSATQFPK